MKFITKGFVARSAINEKVVYDQLSIVYEYEMVIFITNPYCVLTLISMILRLDNWAI